MEGIHRNSETKELWVDKSVVHVSVPCHVVNAPPPSLYCIVIHSCAGQEMIPA